MCGDCLVPFEHHGWYQLRQDGMCNHVELRLQNCKIVWRCVKVSINTTIPTMDNRCQKFTEQLQPSLRLEYTTQQSYKKVSTLESWGHKVICGPHHEKRHLYTAGTVSQRFRPPMGDGITEIDIVWFIRGGYGTAQLTRTPPNSLYKTHCWI